MEVNSFHSSFPPLELRRRFLGVAGVVAICAMLTSCVLPPPGVGSYVLPAEEVSVVALLQRGEHYSQSGRTDLAEVEFRKALALQPDLPNLLNNLGFALL
jgi:hypothetical protein